MLPTPATTIYPLYGDLAYPQSVYLLGGFQNVEGGSNEALYNRLLSSVRITVEWGFGELVDQWKLIIKKGGISLTIMGQRKTYNSMHKPQRSPNETRG